MGKPLSHQPVLLIHAGAGFVPREAIYQEYKIDVYNGLNAALDAGIAVLHQGGSSVDAVQAAVVLLEECPRFNAGRGSVLTADSMYSTYYSLILIQIVLSFPIDIPLIFNFFFLISQNDMN